MFDNLRVLELSSVLAGPSVGQFFAELGAEVIKVENPATNGDVTRSWKAAGEQTDDRSAYFCAVNWGKKSVTIALETPTGRAAVHALAKRADVVIASYKPGDAEKLKVDYQTLSTLNPRLIYGQITGYGSHDARVGYDAVLQAEAGFMYMNGEANGPSLKMPVALIDVLAGHQLKEGLLLSLLRRERTGEGSFVEVSLVQAAVASLVNQATNWLVGGALPGKQGSAHPNIAPYGDVFRTVDGHEILLAIGSDRQFQDLCTLLEMPDVAASPLYTTNALRVRNRASLNLLLQHRIAQQYADQLVIALNRFKLPGGVIKNMQQVFEMPEAKALLIQTIDRVGLRSYVANPSPALPANFLPPPHLGEHTDELIALLKST